MTEKRSSAITQGFERTPHRALLKGTGVPQQQMDKPFIGIASSFTDLIPGHTGMRDLERFIEKGVHTGGGHSFIFGIPGVCDGIAMGHRGMHYSLPTRELIADMVESIAEAHRLDGLVLLTNCDKITPGMLMAAKALLDRNPSPTRDEVIEAISGNICRCTGYEPIITAILNAAAAGGARRYG